MDARARRVVECTPEAVTIPTKIGSLLRFYKPHRNADTVLPWNVELLEAKSLSDWEDIENELRRAKCGDSATVAN